MRPMSIALFLGIALSACDGGPPQATADDTMPAQDAAPSEVGEAIGQLYVEALDETGRLLADQPAPPQVAGELSALKERYVQQVVKLGHRVKSMPETERAEVESAVSRVMTSLRYDDDLKPIWDSYQEAQAHYLDVASEHPEFWDTLLRLNILTQYAFFDLLEDQAPAEAERLGVNQGGQSS